MKKEDVQQEKEILRDDELSEDEGIDEIQHLKTKPVPAVIMLTAGLIAAVYTFIQGIGLYRSLITIFTTLIVFLIIGEIIKALLDRIEIVIHHGKEEEETQDVPLEEEGSPQTEEE